MSSSVTLTASMRKNLLNLQQTQKLFDTTQQRLSTGKKVNSALDNPSSYFSAQSLTSRADGLSSLLDSMGQAVQTLTAADNSITSLTTLVDQAKALANTARDTANVASYAKGDVNLKPLGAPSTDLPGVEQSATFSIRLGDGDTIKGTKNVTLTQTLKDLGYATTNSSGYLSIKVGDTNFINVTAQSSDTVETLAKRINDNTRLKGLVTAGVEDGKFVIKSTDAKNAVSIAAIDGTGAHVTAGASSVNQALGLNEGFHIRMTNAPAAAKVEGGVFVFDGNSAATTAKIADVGISPTPAKVRVTVGENSTLMQFNGTATLSYIATKLSTIADITATYAQADGMTITGTAGKAIKLEDVEGNLFKNLGVATADYVKAYTGSVDELVDEINKQSTDLHAEIDKDGKLKVSATNGEQMTITDVASASGVTGRLADALGITGLADNGTNNRKAYAEQFNTVLDQIDQLVQNGDSGYKGVNLLNGDDLTVNFNEDRTSSLLIKGTTFDTKGLGLNSASNEWRKASDIDAALANVDTAMSRLKTKASEFGQNLSVIQTRQDFTENMINTLTTGADDLTLADMNEESANLLALQTRQQLATNALSLASQSQQSVLSLF